MGEKLIFELGTPGRRAVSLPACDVPQKNIEDMIPRGMLREKVPRLPEVSEVECVRHFTALSCMNHGVDNGFYPLGSCTMKYNPKLNEDVAALRGFTGAHPLSDVSITQGCLEVLAETEQALCAITGMDAFTMQPAAGAHGELCGLMMIKAYHESRGDAGRVKIIVPDSSHGTNPASAAIAGFTVVEIKSMPDGSVDLDALREAAGPDTAGLMLTNPNTLGRFDRNIVKIAEIVHTAGGLLYYDGANMNAIMGIARPGDMGFDVVHINLHKTFSTPHGGGGPGSGPVGVKRFLEPFLPVPRVVKKEGGFALDYDRPQSIGQMKAFYGNFGVIVKALAYIKALGAEGLKEASENAVLNANYVMHRLRGHYDVAGEGPCMHEFVASCENLSEYGVHALDVAKALIDRGFHPPTIYFPLIVKEALMIEPTETETRETLDAFCDTMIEIAYMARTDADSLHAAPVTMPVSRLDETSAARNPRVRHIEEGSL